MLRPFVSLVFAKRLVPFAFALLGCGTEKQTQVADADQDPPAMPAPWKPDTAPPQIVGHLVGPGAMRAQPDVRIYGTDQGVSFEHDGNLVILFGDTAPYPEFLCEGIPVNDDIQGYLPLEMPREGAPALELATRPEASTELDFIHVYRDGESLHMGSLSTPISGFSDGEHAFGVFSRNDHVQCVLGPDDDPICPADPSFPCSQRVGYCLLPGSSLRPLCDRESGAGCFGLPCFASPHGYCVDPTSSQLEYGQPNSIRFAVPQEIEIAAQRPAEPTGYDSAAVFETNKFGNLTTRTVAHFTGSSDGNDYRPGHHTLFMWGRPGWSGEEGRQSHVYLLTHPLPLQLDSDGKTDFRPRYFAGRDADSGEPLWTSEQRDAAPLALDGQVGGDPHEDQVIVNTMTMTWVGGDIRKWVMLYGGDLPDFMLADPWRARNGDAPGAVRIRYADHPWGPWSEAEPHLIPGSPLRTGDLYGPNGKLYHVLCLDQGDARCAKTDPLRPLHLLAGCKPPPVEGDIGRLYGTNFIDAYTTMEASGAANLYWNVSTWNPYGLLLLKTRIQPRSGEGLR